MVNKKSMCGGNLIAHVTIHISKSHVPNKPIKVDMHDLGSYNNWTSIFSGIYVVTCGFNNQYQRYVCL